MEYNNLGDDTEDEDFIRLEGMHIPRPEYDNLLQYDDIEDSHLQERSDIIHSIIVKDVKASTISRIFKAKKPDMEEALFLFELASNLNKTTTPSVRFMKNMCNVNYMINIPDQANLRYEYEDNLPVKHSLIQIRWVKGMNYYFRDVYAVNTIERYQFYPIKDSVNMQEYARFSDCQSTGWFGYPSQKFVTLNMHNFNLCSWKNDPVEYKDAVLISLEWVVRHLDRCLTKAEPQELDVFTHAGKTLKVGLKYLYDLVEQIHLYQNNEQKRKMRIRIVDNFVFKKLCVHYNRIHDIGGDRCHFGEFVIYRDTRHVNYRNDPAHKNFKVSSVYFDSFHSLDLILELDEIRRGFHSKFFADKKDNTESIVKMFDNSEHPSHTRKAPNPYFTPEKLSLRPILFSLFELFFNRSKSYLVLTSPRLSETQEGQWGFWGYVPNISLEQLDFIRKIYLPSNFYDYWLHPEYLGEKDFDMSEDETGFGSLHCHLIRLRQYQLLNLNRPATKKDLEKQLYSVVLAGNLICLLFKIICLHWKHDIILHGILNDTRPHLSGKINSNSEKWMIDLVCRYHTLIHYDLGFIIDYFFEDRK